VSSPSPRVLVLALPLRVRVALDFVVCHCATLFSSLLSVRLPCPSTSCESHRPTYGSYLGILFALRVARGYRMGWRSWNCYHADISQEKMTTAANAFVDTSRGLSLKEVGFVNVGLDDYYQACGTGANGSFHNASGYRMSRVSFFAQVEN
jgi:hypothetical protein